MLDDIAQTNEPLATSLEEANEGCVSKSARLFFRIICSLTRLYDAENDGPLREFFVQFQAAHPTFAQLVYEDFDEIAVSYLVCVFLSATLHVRLSMY